MSTVYATVFICLVLSIAAFASLRICRTGAAYDAEIDHEHELSNAEVTAIITKRA